MSLLRRKRMILVIVAVLCVLCGLFIVAVEREVRQSGLILMDVSAETTSPVAIVLGAQVYKNGRLSAALEDRVITAVKLYKNGSVEKLLLSGDSERPHKYDEVGAMKRVTLEMGVPEADIILDPLGVRTYESMVRASKVFGITHATVVTQMFHMPRSLYLADKMNINVTGAVADRREYKSKYLSGWREFVARVVAWFDVTLS